MAELRDDRNGNYIAEHYPASQEAVDALLASPVGDDGRSEWTWLRLANGDLMLGIFPTGEMYFELELTIEADYRRSETTEAEAETAAILADPDTMEAIAEAEAELGPCILTEADILAGRDDDCTTHPHERTT